MKMRHSAMALLGIVSMSLAGCSTGYWHTSDVSTLEIIGAGFEAELAKAYKDQSVFEYYQMQDYEDAAHFAGRAKSAAAGFLVEPGFYEERDIDAKYIPELEQAHALIINALETKKTLKNYPLLARAQVKYDCWLEQIEENTQPDHIAACRDDFFRALGGLDQPYPEQKAFQVFFDTGSTKFDPAALQTLNRAARYAAVHEMHYIITVGNTDTQGNSANNDVLSRKRSHAVREALVKAGIRPEYIRLESKGEHNLIIPTPDNTKEEKNRRVDIYITRP